MKEKIIKNKKNLLFDFDGTIVDSSQGIYASIQYALKCLDLPQVDQKVLSTFIGPPLLESFKQLGLTDDEAHLAVANYRSYYAQQAIYQVQMYPQIKEVLQKLSQDYQLYIASSKPEIFVSKIVDHLAIRSLFSGIYGADLEGVRSKKSDVIQYALEQAHLKVDETVMIGDRSHDCLGAKANQLISIGVLYGFGSKKELLVSGADYLCTAPMDLCELFVTEKIG